MRFLSWNVNGVRAVMARGDLDWLWSSDADVVCLQETKISDDAIPPELDARDGWNAFWSCSQTRKVYSGTAVFVRDHLPATLVARGIGEEKFDQEGRVVAVDLDEVLLYNIYFPNGGRGPERLQYKLDFYAQFQKTVQAHVDAGRDVVVCGDVNTAHREIDTARPEIDSKHSGFLDVERAWVDQFLDAGWVDTLRAEHPLREGDFTWWDYRTDARPDNIGMRIDYFFVNARLEESIVDAWVAAQVMGSDHCPVGLELESAFDADEDDFDAF